VIICVNLKVENKSGFTRQVTRAASSSKMSEETHYTASFTNPKDHTLTRNIPSQSG